MNRQASSPSTPFDYPFVFAGLLLALGLWFGYDGWFNPETKSVGFNRILFCVFAVAFSWVMWTDLRIMRNKKERKIAKELAAAADVDADVTSESS